MKTLLTLLILWAGIPGLIYSQSITSADSTEIAQKIEDWNTGWIEKDYEIATKWYSDQAEFTNAFGHNMVGKPEIRSLLKEVFSLPFVMAGSSRVAGQKMVPVSENVVLVITQIERLGQEMPDGTGLDTRKTTHHRLFVKEAEWLIAGHLISDARDRDSSGH
jgi:ketosteroid isomerase-like protein